MDRARQTVAPWTSRYVPDITLAVAALLLLVLSVRTALWDNVQAVARRSLPAEHVVDDGDLRLAPTFKKRTDRLVIRQPVTAGQRLRRSDLRHETLPLGERRILNVRVDGLPPIAETPWPAALAVGIPEQAGWLVEDAWILGVEGSVTTVALRPRDIDQLSPYLAHAKFRWVSSRSASVVSD